MTVSPSLLREDTEKLRAATSPLAADLAAEEAGEEVEATARVMQLRRAMTCSMRFSESLVLDASEDK